VSSKASRQTSYLTRIGALLQEHHKQQTKTPTNIRFTKLCIVQCCRINTSVFKGTKHQSAAYYGIPNHRHIFVVYKKASENEFSKSTRQILGSSANNLEGKREVVKRGRRALTKAGKRGRRRGRGRWRPPPPRRLLHRRRPPPPPRRLLHRRLLHRRARRGVAEARAVERRRARRLGFGRKRRSAHAHVGEKKGARVNRFTPKSWLCVAHPSEVRYGYVMRGAPYSGAPRMSLYSSKRTEVPPRQQPRHSLVVLGFACWLFGRCQVQTLDLPPFFVFTKTVFQKV
jgi:hypothetical protein